MMVSTEVGGTGARDRGAEQESQMKEERTDLQGTAGLLVKRLDHQEKIKQY